MTDTTTIDAAEDETPDDHVRPLRLRHTLSWRPALRVVFEAGLVVTVVLLPLIYVFRLWERGFRVPFSYVGDANFYAGVTANIIENGWYQETDRLGAPFGQELYDFALGGDNFHWLMIRLLALFSQDWALVNNAFYLLTFPLAALSAFFASRWLGARTMAALTAGVLFAFIPYHFIRGAGHLVLASYAIVPIGVVLAVRVARGQGLLWELRRRTRYGWLISAGWILGAILVGSSSTYYAAFSLLLIAAAGVFGSLARRHWAPLVAAVTVALLIAAVLAANLLPTLLYARAHGENAQVGTRYAEEVDYYGLRVAQLLTPVPGHRAEPLARVSEVLQNTAWNSEQSMFLGSIAGIGLIAMIGSIFVRILRRPPPKSQDDVDDEQDDDLDEARSLLAVFTVVSILVGTIGGLSWFVALAGLEEIRSWNRISIVVAFLVLAWMALTIESFLRRRPNKKVWQRIAVGGAAIVIVLAIADQTSPAIVPDRRLWVDVYAADRAYFSSIERELPNGAAVFQLPYVPYPESGPIIRIADYDPLRPYLHTQDVRWSYGGIKGRQADWQLAVVSQPIAELVEDVRGEGFAGVLVDRNGYEDGALGLVSELQATTQDAGFGSADGRWVFFDLTASTG